MHCVSTLDNVGAGQEAGQLDVKGLQSVRRDSCTLLRDTLQGCLEALLRHGDVGMAQGLVEHSLARLLARQVCAARLSDVCTARPLPCAHHE